MPQLSAHHVVIALFYARIQINVWSFTHHRKSPPPRKRNPFELQWKNNLFKVPKAAGGESLSPRPNQTFSIVPQISVCQWVKYNPNLQGNKTSTLSDSPGGIERSCEAHSIYNSSLLGRHTDAHKHTLTHRLEKKTKKTTPPTFSITPPQAHTHPGWLMSTHARTNPLSVEFPCNPNAQFSCSNNWGTFFHSCAELLWWIRPLHWTLTLGWKEVQWGSWLGFLARGREGNNQHTRRHYARIWNTMFSLPPVWIN